MQTSTRCIPFERGTGVPSAPSFSNSPGALVMRCRGSIWTPPRTRGRVSPVSGATSGHLSDCLTGTSSGTGQRTSGAFRRSRPSRRRQPQALSSASSRAPARRRSACAAAPKAASRPSVSEGAERGRWVGEANYNVKHAKSSNGSGGGGRRRAVCPREADRKRARACRALVCTTRLGARSTATDNHYCRYYWTGAFLPRLRESHCEQRA
jgi:hypothetical protein